MSIEKLLDRCPQAIIPYANQQLQEKNMVCTDHGAYIWSLYLDLLVYFSFRT